MLAVKDKVEHRSQGYNTNFYPDTGVFERWGNTEKQDAKYSPIGPETMEIEISTVCHGINGKMCSHCHSKNGPTGKNMSFAIFKDILEKVSGNLSFIHFRTADLDANPDLGKMLRECLEYDITPGISIANVKDEAILYEVMTFCGYADVIYNGDREACFKIIEFLLERNMPNVNLRMMLSKDMAARELATIIGVGNNSKINGLNSIKLDQLVPANAAENLDHVDDKQLESILDIIRSNNLALWASPCLVNKIIKVYPDYGWMEDNMLHMECCEAGLFSGYVNVDGKFWPCPYMEHSWAEGVPLQSKDSFVNEVWNSDDMHEWQDMLLDMDRECPVFP